jgi:hypothetical protein
MVAVPNGGVSEDAVLVAYAASVLFVVVFAATYVWVYADIESALNKSFCAKPALMRSNC